MLEFQAAFVCVRLGKQNAWGRERVRGSLSQDTVKMPMNTHMYTHGGQRGMSCSSSIDLKAIDSPEYTVACATRTYCL